MIRARGVLHKLGGARGVPAWGKLWLAILNVYDWEGMHPIPPELWCLPDWVPFHPWRWWIHTRMVYLPMGYLWAKRFRCPVDPLIESLRQVSAELVARAVARSFANVASPPCFAQELYIEPYASIDWPSQRNHVAKVDIWAPHTKTMEGLMAALGVYESCGAIPPLRRAGIQRAYKLLAMEDENTSYQTVGPVSKMLNYICRWIEEGPESEVMVKHREKLRDFMWMGKEGMMMTGTNGSQLWGEFQRRKHVWSTLAALPSNAVAMPFWLLPDTAFIAQAMVDSGLVDDEDTKSSCRQILDWLDEHQIRDNPKHYNAAYRYSTKGAWPFSTKEQSYTVSDCTGEGMKATIMLQNDAKWVSKCRAFGAEHRQDAKSFFTSADTTIHRLPQRIAIERLHDSVDLLLTMQNRSGGFASYETINGPGELTALHLPAATRVDSCVCHYGSCA